MAALRPPICDFGWEAIDFDLEGVDGRRYTLADVRGENGTLVIFMCNHCPYVKAVIDRIGADARALEAEGIGAIGIMSNDIEAFPADGFENMKRFAEAHAIHFPYVIDRSQDVARAYDAICTPDFFGFDADLGLQYRGRLDETKQDPVPGAKRELLEAMIGISRTGKGPDGQIASMGCSIKWRGAA